jgi:hypothetical protein
MKFIDTNVYNIEQAIKGIRNSWESWDKSDSCTYYACYDEDSGWIKNPCTYDACGHECDHISAFAIGIEDMKLAQNLIKAGSDHRKFMRQILVSVTITAPLYWWKEFDTYKVGTVSNSTGTMHTLTKNPITFDCFEHDDFNDLYSYALPYLNNNPCVDMEKYWNANIEYLEYLRKLYLSTKDEDIWKELIRALPESWLQTRAITMNYENIYNMIHQRKDHKLTEWSKKFIEWTNSLPYANELFHGLKYTKVRVDKCPD